MAGLLNPEQMASALWPGLKAKFEAQYDGVELFNIPSFFYTYRTSPLFGIFRIRS